MTSLEAYMAAAEAERCDLAACDPDPVRRALAYRPAISQHVEPVNVSLLDVDAKLDVVVRLIVQAKTDCQAAVGDVPITAHGIATAAARIRTEIRVWREAYERWVAAEEQLQHRLDA